MRLQINIRYIFLYTHESGYSDSNSPKIIIPKIKTKRIGAQLIFCASPMVSTPWIHSLGPLTSSRDAQQEAQDLALAHGLNEFLCNVLLEASTTLGNDSRQ